MTTIKVGGVTGLLANRTAAKGFEKARDGDTVKLAGLTTRLLDGVPINSNLYIESKLNTAVITDKYSSGFYIGTTNNVEFDNVYFDVAPQSNAISTADDYIGNLTLNYINSSSRKAKLTREYYPHIIINGGNKIILNHCDLRSIAINAPDGEIEIKNSNLGTEFEANSQIVAAKISIFDSELQNITIASDDLTITNTVSKGDVYVGGNVEIKNMSYKYIQPKLTPKDYDEPIVMLGTLENTEALIDNVSIQQVPDEAYDTKTPLSYYGIYIDNSEVIFKNSKIINLTNSNVANDSTITAIDSEISDDWIQNGNVVFNQQNSVGVGNDENDAMHELESMIGLNDAKRQMKKMINTASLNKIRADKGLPVPDDFSLHMIFQGNAGTGKTTIARLYGQALFERGVLPTNKFVETSAGDLVAGYVRQTAKQTQEVIDQAIGGVLFIDEAYALIPHDGVDFSDEAITTLLKEIENRRSEFVVILAGYTNDINQLIKTNQGLASRIPNRVTFEDYSPEDILNITFGMFQAKDMNVRKTELEQYVPSLYSQFKETGADVGNARWARNFVQEVIMAQNDRLANIDPTDLSNTQLSTITIDDIINGSNTMIDNFNAQEDYQE